MGLYQGKINGVNYAISQKESELSDLLAKIKYLSSEANGSIASIKRLTASTGRSDVRGNAFSNNNATSLFDINSGIQEILIDGNVWTYNPKSKILTYYDENGKKQVVGCGIYTSSGNIHDITNVVTVLGGDGKTEKGKDFYNSSKGVLKNVNLDSNSLMIIPFGNNGNHVSSNGVIACSRFIDNLVGNNDMHRFIIGHSQGSIIATEAINNHPRYYTDIIFINGGTTTAPYKGSSKELVSNYDAFSGTNVTYVITKKGWGSNGHKSNDAAKLSISDLIEANQQNNLGINISLISSDNELIGAYRGNNGIHINTTESNRLDGLSGHGNAWNILNNIIDINWFIQNNH